MGDQAIDDEGNVYEQGWDGQYRQKRGIFGSDRETDIFGTPKVDRDIFGSSGQPLFERGSSGGIEGAAGSCLGWVLMIALFGIFMLAWALLKFVWRHPRIMLPLLLVVGAVFLLGGGTGNIVPWNRNTTFYYGPATDAPPTTAPAKNASSFAQETASDQPMPVTGSEEAAPDQPMPVTGSEGVSYYHVVNVQSGGALNVRISAGVDHQSVGTIPYNGSDIEVTGQGMKVGESLWVPIKYGALTGWVNSHFLASQSEQFIQAAEVQVSAEVKEHNYSGSCPATFTFVGELRMNGPGTVTYQWDGSRGATEPETIVFQEAGSKHVELDVSVATSRTGWILLRILSPNTTDSHRVDVALTCVEDSMTVD
jgi:hypothetical protein